jgi:hypothetical protein
MNILPSPTLYLQGLNDKIKKNDLKTLLYHLFTSHGRIVDVVALRTLKLRGQVSIIANQGMGSI